MIVVDTNVIAYLLIKGANTALAERVLDRDKEWAAPFLWRSEFRNVLSLYMRQNLMVIEDAKKFMADAEELMLSREFAVDSKEVLELAKTSGCSAYDCEFVVLAKKLAVKLVALDKKIIAAFPSVAESMDNYS